MSMAHCDVCGKDVPGNMKGEVYKHKCKPVMSNPSVTRAECEAWSVRADDAGRLARAYLALLDSREWKPIETAPKDGTPFLLACSNAKYPQVACFKDGEFRSTHYAFREPYWHFTNPTGWMPLPDPLPSKPCPNLRDNAASSAQAPAGQPTSKVRVGTSCLTKDLVWCDCGRGLSLSGKWLYCPTCGARIDQESYASAVEQARSNGASPFYKDPDELRERELADKLADALSGLFDVIPQDLVLPETDTARTALARHTAMRSGK